MRLSRILVLQIALETSVYTVVGFTAAIAILLGQNMVRRLDALTTIGLTADDLLVVMRSLLLMLTPYAIPIAFLFGALLTTRRMAMDGETLAMQSSGMGSFSFLLPTVSLGLCISLLCGYLMLFVEHDSRREILTVFKQAAARGGGLEAGEFRLVADRLIFVEERSREGDLEGVMIVDYSTPGRQMRIFAELGRVSFDDATQLLHFQLLNGDLHFLPSHTALEMDRRLAFEEFDYSFDISSLLGDSFSPNRPRQMSLEELAAIQLREQRGESFDGLDERDPVEYAIEKQRRYALPGVALLFALIAVPLGGRVSTGGRAWGVLLCIGVVTGYYSLFALSQSIARSGILPVTAALWLPNLLMGALAIFLIARDETAVPK